MINRYENRRLNALKEKEARFNKLLTVKDSILKLCLEGKSFLYITNNGEKLLGRKITRWDLNLIYEREGLKRPSIKDAANSKHTRDMYKDTVQKLYGEDISNVSQSAKIKAKKIEVVEHKSEFASIPVASVKYLNDPVSDSKFKHDSSLSTFKVLRTKQSF